MARCLFCFVCLYATTGIDPIDTFTGPAQFTPATAGLDQRPSTSPHSPLRRLATVLLAFNPGAGRSHALRRTEEASGRAASMQSRMPRPLKIRTVTTFIQLRPNDEEQWRTEITHAVAENKVMKTLFEDEGYEVQTSRISTNPFSEYLSISEPTEVTRQCRLIDTILTDAGAAAGPHGLLNLGPAQSLEDLAMVPAIVAASQRLFCCAQADLSNLHEHGVASDEDVKFAEAMGVAVRKVADASAGEGSFQFCMMAGMPPLTPFFPASFAEPLSHQQPDSPANRGRGVRSCAVGLQFPDIVVEAFSAASGSSARARELLFERCSSEFRSVQALLMAHEDAEHGLLKLPGLDSSLHYVGIDVSVAPCPECRSLIEGFEALLPPGSKFGQSGTLALCSMLSRVLHEIRDGDEIRTVGYCGLMLPPLEDTGLAQRASEGVLDIAQLMQYSAVCGLGLDCVPVPGDVSPKQLAAVYLDISALSARLGKPLSARLFPVPAKAAGDTFESDNPNLCNGAVFSL